MRLFIPEIWTKLELTRNWSFKLYDEYRNEGLFKAFNICIHPVKERKEKGSSWRANFTYYVFSKDIERSKLNYSSLHRSEKHLEEAIRLYWIEEIIEENERVATVSFPKGTILTVDRIYIRKWASDYSSISFYAKHIELGKKRVRFWAKLNDVNNIDCEIIEE